MNGTALLPCADPMFQAASGNDRELKQMLEMRAVSHRFFLRFFMAVLMMVLRAILYFVVHPHPVNCGHQHHQNDYENQKARFFAALPSQASLFLPDQLR